MNSIIQMLGLPETVTIPVEPVLTVNTVLCIILFGVFAGKSLVKELCENFDDYEKWL